MKVIKSLGAKNVDSRAFALVSPSIYLASEHFVASSAVKMGSVMLELDCHLTKDEEVVVSHDNDLTRETGVPKNISDLNFDELPQYKETLEVTFGFGEFDSS